jgi:hypothetical protein
LHERAEAALQESERATHESMMERRALIRLEDATEKQRYRWLACTDEASRALERRALERLHEAARDQWDRCMEAERCASEASRHYLDAERAVREAMG